MAKSDDRCASCGMARGFHGDVLEAPGDPQCAGFVEPAAGVLREGRPRSQQEQLREVLLASLDVDEEPERDVKPENCPTCGHPEEWHHPAGGCGAGVQTAGPLCPCGTPTPRVVPMVTHTAGGPKAITREEQARMTAAPRKTPNPNVRSARKR